MKKLSINGSLVSMSIISFLILISCESNSIIKETEIVNNKETSVKLKKEILSFDSETEFNSVLENLNQENENALKKGMTTRSLNSNKIDNFHSLYDEFNEAMEVAESYYEREGGYEEFKLRFSNLYYPEYGDDYSAYLPVSDKAVAKLLNNKGEVIIDGVKKNMKDINSYEQLEKLGLTFPEKTNSHDIQVLSNNWGDDPYYPTLPPPPSSDYHSISLNTDIYNADNNRRFKVNRLDVRNFPTEYWLDITLEIVFRKKGFLGWYNYSSEGFIGVGARQRNDPVPARGTPGFGYDSGASPLSFHYLQVWPFIPPFSDFTQCVWYRGQGKWAIFNSLEKRR